MKNKKLKQLKLLSKHIHYYNNMAPFPPFDTEYVKDVDNLIKTMEDNKKINYDDDPVWACRFCKNLKIEIDELNNNVCMHCGSVNETTEFKDIYEYLKFKNNYNE